MRKATPTPPSSLFYSPPNSINTSAYVVTNPTGELKLLFHPTGWRGASEWQSQLSQLSILRAIVSSDLHNLVYRADYRIVPAVTADLGHEDREFRR